MCNRFNLKTDLAQVAKQLDATMPRQLELAEDIFPGKPAAAVAMNRNGQREVLPMAFGLVPFGKTPQSQRRPLTNARVENLSKWPWKSAIKSHRCIVPMNSFREPCYWGETAGSEVDFHAPANSVMLAAAMFTWYEESSPDDQNQETNPAVFTMSLIMRPALPTVMEHGHHRSPFFLSEEGVQAWIQREPRELDESLTILKHHATEPTLSMTVAREMAPAWKKRQSTNVAKRDEQLAAISVSGPLGIPDSIGSGSNETPSNETNESA
ncbi:SOS response-associated peptidase [Rhodopirellula halodulae]|uniref:SOS response-associated peptidase n=1 Tax=Rhodopirellula halodulae TaxID=2894198 RepID=UPI001E586584|nr:SOS response-associated peptidase family protein [Rhodopirellula sp. JC737]MCC9658905.1 SOS response-associated peptidase family protein [Rhodopirellula sp. JC737]